MVTIINVITLPMPAPANLSNTLPIDAQYHLIPCLAAALPPCPIPTCHSQAIAMTPAGPNSAMRERLHLRATQLNPAPKTASRRSAPYCVSSHDPKIAMSRKLRFRRDSLTRTHAIPPNLPKPSHPTILNPVFRKLEIPLRIPLPHPMPLAPPQQAPSRLNPRSKIRRYEKWDSIERLPGLGTFAIRPTTCALTSQSP